MTALGNSPARKRVGKRVGGNSVGRGPTLRADGESVVCSNLTVSGWLHTARRTLMETSAGLMILLLEG